MKKLLSISVIAALAVLPMAANAAVTDMDPGATNADAPVAAEAPKYSLVNGDETDANLATAGYVKGAYNATIKAINKVATMADSAVKTVAEGTTNGTIAVDGTNVAVHGLGSAAYTDSDAYATASQGEKADQAALDIGTLSNLGTTNKDSLVGAINEVNTAAGFAGTAAQLSDTHFTDADKTSASTAANAAMAAAAAAQTDANTANTNIGTLSNLGTTNKESLVGAINELKDASGDYATKTGVLATINASTLPVMNVWGSTTATTVTVDAPENFVNQ